MQLFKKKTDGGDTQTNKEEKISGLSLGKVNLISFLITVIFVLLSAYFSYLLYADRIERHQKDINHAALNKIASELSGRIKSLVAVTNQFVKSESTLRQISNSDIDPDLQQTLKSIYPGFIRALVLSEKSSDPIDNLTPPFSYACLDLHLNTKTGASHFEVHRLHTEDQHIDIIIPISQSKNKLLITLDVSMLKQWLDPLLPANTYISLTQKTPGQTDAMVLLKSGNESFASNKTFIHTTINQGNWQLNLATEDQNHLVQIDHLLYLSTFFVATVLIAITFLLVSKLSDRLVRNDLEILIKYLHTASKGGKKSVAPVRLVEFIKAMKAIDHLVGKINKKP